MSGASIQYSPVVETRAGAVRGQAQAEGFAFRGIPYGADTGGTNRFMPPQPVAAWSGVREATAFGARAPQIGRMRAPGFDWLNSELPTSEDCLVLNVFTPALEGRRPVMVWLHGGAFMFGSADAPVYEAGTLAAHGDVVVVSLNHRLNVFGYLPPMGADERFADSGNAGMLDIVVALEWIRDNIAAFGGDPDSVTLFGQSGGGAKAAILMAMPQARGLFHRTIIQSPSSGFKVQPADEAARLSHELLARLQLDASRLADLQQVPALTLLKQMFAVVADNQGDDHFRPVIDGRSLTRHPFFPSAPDGTESMPLMIGYAATEASFYLAGDPANWNLAEAQVCRRIARFMKISEVAAASIMQRYAGNHPQANASDLLMHIASDHMYRLTTIEGAEQKAAQGGAPVYLYRFAWSSPWMDGKLRTPHTAELPFVFGKVNEAADFTGADEAAQALSVQMMDIWTRFARSGDPNGPGLPRWDAFDLTRRATMCLDAPASSLVDDPLGADRRIMAEYRRFEAGSAINYRAD